MKFNKKLVIIISALAIITTGCNNSKVVNNNKQQETVNISNSVDEKANTEESEKQVDETEKEDVNNQEISEESNNIDLEKIKPNEGGQVMVLMYHSISSPEAEFTRTPDNFRKDLQILYDKGYRPISLTDYVTGNITTEAGYTPVVITFDDGWQNNFNMVQDENSEWVIDPDCAVSILEKFNEEHPDFPLEATFFVNNNVPFGQSDFLEYKLKYVVDKGMDVGNHTNTHVNFTDVDANRIQKEIGVVKTMVNKYLPDYEVNTLALPFGSRPKNDQLSTYLEKGNFDGVDYKNIAILNVGWDPNRSPYHIKFDPLVIHRVRASDIQKYVEGVGIYDWIKRFEKGERTKFVSDGNPNTITIPEGYLEVIDINRTGDRKIITY